MEIKVNNLLRTHQLDIVALNELRLDKHVEKNAVNCTDVYEVVRRSDRKTGPHGRVLIYIKCNRRSISYF